MKHALIIEDGTVPDGFLRASLTSLGFQSFDRVSTEDDAVAAADRRRPDLIIVADDIEDGCGIRAARRICRRDDIPAMVIAERGAAERRRLPSDAHIEGPYPVDKIAHLTGDGPMNRAMAQPEMAAM